jgi:hypothetical protein
MAYVGHTSKYFCNAGVASLGGMVLKIIRHTTGTPYRKYSVIEVKLAAHRGVYCFTKDSDEQVNHNVDERDTSNIDNT